MKLQDIGVDDGVLAEFGARLARVRIDMRLTQEELAAKAGVGKRTLERLEAGDTTQTKTLVRVMRALDLLGQLDAAVPAVEVRPMYIVREKQGLPRRVRKGRADTAERDGWTWGDEKP